MTELNKLLNRIKQTQDGIDFIEYLKVLSYQNYQSFKKDDSDKNDVYKGCAIAIDDLIKAFENASEKQASVKEIDWTN